MKKQAVARNRRLKTKTNQSWFFLLGLIAISTWVTWKHEQFSPHLSVAPVRPAQQPQKIVTGTGSYLKSSDASKIDSYASSLPYNGASVSELASQLSRLALTDTEKARAIYTWMAHHIAYDVQMFYSGQYRSVRPEEVLKTRKAICSGYATLYQALAEEMGLQAEIIPGAAKGVSYAIGSDSDENHAWNAVKIDNVWYLVDVTWGSGILQDRQFKRQFNPHYFATPPEQFIYDHLPSDSSWQLLQTRYTKEQFEALPQIRPEFFRDGLQLVSHPTHTIQAQGTTEVILQAPSDTMVSARLESESGLLDSSYTLVQREQDKITVNAAFPQSGTYELQIFSKKKDDGGLYPQAIAYKVIAHSQGEEFPKTYSHFAQNNAYLYTPLTKSIPAHQSVYFQIDVPHALRVAVIDRALRDWVNLERQGTTFAGTVKVGSGKVALAAQFAEGDRYWTLVEYR